MLPIFMNVIKIPSSFYQELCAPTTLGWFFSLLPLISYVSMILYCLNIKNENAPGSISLWFTPDFVKNNHFNNLREWQCPSWNLLLLFIISKKKKKDKSGADNKLLRNLLSILFKTREQCTCSFTVLRSNMTFHIIFCIR